MRISGITIQDNKRLQVGLTAVFGIGPVRSKNILDKMKLGYEKKAKDLTPAEEQGIRDLIAEYRTEGDLKRDAAGNVKRLKDIQSHRGMRHSKHLPVRGQRTKTNSRTARGNTRKTMGSGRRSADKK